MKVLRFTLSGEHAFFKKPEVNSYCYFTYGNIHKVALLGLFGAILGYGGYSQMNGFQKSKKSKEVGESYPEFYGKLKDLHISILPAAKYKKGVIPKKVQIFNNSVGYASREQGGNLIIKEQWLEQPKWEICLLLDCKEAEKLSEVICEKKCVYYPYLGKNDHPADLTQVSVEEIQKIDFRMGRMDCLVPTDEIDLADLDYEEKEDMEAFGTFKYIEELPCQLDGWMNHYIFRTFLYTDEFVEEKHPEVAIYQLQDKKNIIFY